MGSVHAVEMASLKDSETVCESPLCDNQFPQTGLRIEPRRFCSDRCRQQASLIRRVAKLYGLSPQTMHEVLTKARGYLSKGESEIVRLNES